MLKKYIKTLILTSLVTLIPIIVGLILWDQLPDSIPIHWGINGEPDNWSGKGFAVFGLPIMMAVLQIICCLINDINSKKHGPRKKFETATKSLIPAMSIILQSITLGYAMDMNIDIRRVVIIVVGIIFIVIGNYLPKFDYVKNYNIETEKAKKINRFIGFSSFILGILAIITVFLPPIWSVMWLVLLIPYAITSIIYGIVVGRRK